MSTPATLTPHASRRALRPQASGALRGATLDTAAWRALEALTRRLTRGDTAARRELPAVWAALRATYPKLCVVTPG